MALQTAKGVLVLLAGVIVGLLLRLKWGLLGEIPEATMSLIGAVVGAGLGAAGSFIAAYYLWQQQLRSTESALGNAAADAIGATSAGVNLLLADIDRLPKLTEGYAVGSEALEGLVAHGVALVDAVNGAKANIDRIAPNLGALGAARVPWFMYAEQALDGLDQAASKLRNRNLLPAETNLILLNEEYVDGIRYYAKSLGAAVEELRSGAPSLERLTTLHERSNPVGAYNIETAGNSA